MNQLRQRFLKSRKTSVSRKKRRLFAESLEGRRLLAGDVVLPPMDGLNPNHNYLFSTDTNHDYRTTPLDALLVINHLNSAGTLASGEMSAARENGFKLDVNNDGVVSPIDALMVINRISQGEGENDPILSLKLDVSQNNQSLLRDAQGNVTTRDFQLEVGEKFNLEVLWDYNRPSPFDPALGAFTVYADILASNKTAFEPVLSETQTLTISENLEDARGGSLTLSLPGSTTTSTLTFADLIANNNLDRIARAVERLGYEEGSITVFDIGARISRAQRPETGIGDPFIYSIRYNGDAQEFQDVPRIQVANNLTNQQGAIVPLQIDVAEIPVYIGNNPANGLNPEAFRFNIDFRSTNLGERPLYTSAPSGSITPNGDGIDADVVFNEVGGFSSSIATGGLPQIVNGFGGEIRDNYTGLDFEAFSLELRVVEPAEFVFSLNMPDLTGTQLTVFGNNEALTSDMVEIDLIDDPSVPDDGQGLVRATFVPKAQDITIGPDSLTLNEDTPATIDPIIGLTTAGRDVDNTGGTLSLKANGFTQGANGTVSRVGTTNTLTYTPNLNFFGSDSFEYTVVSSNGAEATGVVTVTVSPINDPPTAVADSGTGLSTPETTALTIPASRLLANDLRGPANESGQTLSVTGVAKITGQTANNTRGEVSFSNNEVIYTPVQDGAYTDRFT